ncbi:unnamed protein product [Schistosoma margrebowiei]|uniref:Uncharacterized protein n=1 Tax=Schistosoma margrebowiei TaxID=48269 RepID=A0A183N275_9TREM|nr:unnamed protein product [Schistosoma margrebowiei]
MVVGGSQQENLDPGFVLVGTHMKFKDNSEFATEEDYDFKALNYTRSWIIAGFIILAVAIALAAASVALPTFVMIAPSVFDASNANVNKARSMGYTQVCFTSDNTCQNRDPSYVDEYSALMTSMLQY